ncbi:tRNA lysidine(34) synthetase TilS [Hugenholtzia roseola]|uniref:tRNA lysidine(34) synthetase TilS n=1 Tax=Hugenholtzia roseola TaxID=1002 RepID=UPI00040926BC|nr:tRNA lysidine(34) synthetase TilS [Hugenholtzia roseola]
MKTELRDRLIAQMADFVAKNALFEKEAPLLVAVSGGIDSVVLCDLLIAQGYKIAIAHCNFSLRGIESDQDQIWVEKFALKNRVPFFSKKFDTLQIIKEQKRKRKDNKEKKQTSIQVIARQLRYQFFLEILEKEKYQHLLTAHHQDDLMESLLLNLCKGTGIAGLRGILPKRPYPSSYFLNQDKSNLEVSNFYAEKNKYYLVRPLLFLNKSHILEYAKKYNLQWREDSSNQTDKYRRNLIRHQVSPILHQVNEKAAAKFAHSAERAAEMEQLFLQHYRFFYKKYVQKTKQFGQTLFKIQYQGLQRSSAPAAILYQLLKTKHFSYHTCQKISNQIKSLQTPLLESLRFESKSHVFLLDKYEIILYPKNSKSSFFVLEKANDKVIFFDKTISTSLISIEKFTASFPAADAPLALFDAAQISFPLHLRLWQAGDSFAPLGMKGRHKKVSDVLNDLKISTFEKNNTWVLLSKGEIIWVVGKRISDLHKVLPTTQTLLAVRIEAEK